MRTLSQSSTGLSRDERRNLAARGGKPALVVYSYNEAAAIARVARRTLERMIALGEGPAIIELSPRRRGILESDLISWLHKHRRCASSRGEPCAAGATSTGAAVIANASIPR
jgi:hypothetical protein